jgi:hypothetical protein
MTQEQLYDAMEWVVTVGFILAIWTWRTVRPYLVLRDIRSGAIAPEIGFLWFLLGPQVVLFLVLPVVAFTAWGVRQTWAIVLLIATFLSGCSTLYFAITMWHEIKRKQWEAASNLKLGT